MIQVFQLVFLVAVGLALLALYKKHSTGKASNVHLFSNTICLASHHRNPSFSEVDTSEVMASSFKLFSSQME
jgi:hypothetical protein